jgi:hypothetical protein
MSLQEDNKAFCDALNRLVTTFIKGGTQAVHRDSVEPNWLTKTNKFIDLVTVVRNLPAGEEKDRKVLSLRNVFAKLSKDSMQNEIVSEGEYNDKFLLTAEDGTGGLSCTVGNYCLPVSEAYTFIKEHVEDEVFPVVMLINFLSCLSLSLPNKSVEFFRLSENIRSLDTLLPKPEKKTNGFGNPLEMLKSMLPADLDMKSMVNEETVGKMKEMLSEFTETFESGGDIMGMLGSKMEQLMEGGVESLTGETPPQSVEDVKETPAEVTEGEST